MTNPTSTPTPPPGAPQPESNRFFTWLRSLGVVRADGWIGGVCGGIAMRTGLDPLIVRGIAVVIAILGGPALLFYAAAWLLLPDTHGEIHLERMLRGVFDAPLIAIAILVVLTFIPFTQGVWWLGGHLVGPAWWIAGPVDALRVLWNLAVLGAIVWFVIWLVQRYRNNPPGQRFRRPDPAQPGSGSGATFASAAPAPASTGPTSAAFAAPAPGTVPEAAAGESSAPQQAQAEASGRTANGAEPPSAPSAPGAGATKDDLSEWRERYAAWRGQHQAWQEAQRAQMRTARDARSAEMRAQSQAFAAQAAQRLQARRAANPRAAGWVVALVLGVALVAGGIAGAAAATSGDLARFAAPIGFAVALIAIGLGMVVAGAARRRSGFLAFMAIVALVIGLGSFGWPAHNPPVGFTQLSADQDATVSQFAGQVELDAASADLGDGTRNVTIKQTFGAVTVYLGDGVRARVNVTSAGSTIFPRVQSDDGQAVEQSRIRVSAPDGNSTVERSWDNLSSGSPNLIVDITQGRGGVYIYDGGGQRPNSGFGRFN